MTSNASPLARAVRLGATLGLLAPAAAVAQPTDLPSLTPRVFESRGAVRVSLPDIERQPLTGFGPPPRVFVVDDTRTPAERPFEPDIDALPAYEIAGPPEPPTDLAEPQSVRAEAGAGTPFARYGRFDLSAAGAGGVFFVDADYDGLSGRESEGQVDFDRVDVRAGGQSFATGRLALSGRVLVDRYTTPGSILSARRERRLIGVGAVTEGVGRIPYGVTLGFQQSGLRRLDDSEAESTEGRLDVAGQVGLFRNRLRLDAAAGTAGAGNELADVQYGAVGAAVALERADGARLVLGVRGLTYDATAVAGGGSSQTLGPIVDVQLPFRDLGTLFVTNDPRLDVRSLADLTGLNPYVAQLPIVSPDVLPIDARAGLEIRRGPARLRGFAMGIYAPTYLVFERLDDDFTETYVDARIYGVGGDLAVASRAGVSGSVGVEFRTAGVDTGDEIPFYAPLALHAGLAAPFDRDRGRIGLTLHAETERPANRADTERAGSFALLSFDARYDVYRPFSVVLRGERLLGEVERWPGFPEAPFAVMLGLRFAR
ncbi:MAG: hypothetical protein AAF845_05145 [Bacteroidota bacterium]